MAITRSQTLSAFALPSLRTFFAEKAEQRRCRTEQQYREKLSPFEKTLYDAFHQAREQNPSHHILAAVAGSSVRKVDDHFTTYPTEAATAEVIETMAADKWGTRIYIALDLRKSFISQWTAAPSGRETDLDYKRAPKKTIGLAFSLPTPPERNAIVAGRREP